MGGLQRFAVVTSAAFACLMLGLLLGVLASGGRASQVLSVIRDPVAPASGATTNSRQPAAVTLTVTRPPASAHTDPPTTVTVTHTVTRPGTTQTITQPATTVTEPATTVTVTVTTTAAPPGSTTGP